LAYIGDTYGTEYVSQIITFGTLSKLTVIHDVLTSANVSNSIINEVKKTIPDDPSIALQDVKGNDKFLTALKNIPFEDTIITVDRSNAQKILDNHKNIDSTDRIQIIQILTGQIQSMQMTVKSSWTWEKALNIMLRLEGLSKNESTHAAGVVVAPVPLATNVPLMRAKGQGPLACQYDMRSLEALGYLKMDALGLRTVDVNHDAGNLVRKWYDKDHDIYNIPYNDDEAIKLINCGDTIGIFQIESTGFTQMMEDLDIGGYEVQRFKERREELLTSIEKLRGLEIKDFMWISAGLALYRPGPLDAIIEGKTMVQHLIDRKSGKEQITYLFPEEKGYLEETYGVLVYQEQVMARVRQMTGCSYGRADILRKAMGKKDLVLMKEQMDWFRENAMNHQFSSDLKFNDSDYKQKIISRAADEIEKFARYGFNKAHTVEYGHICYHNAYYKAHYPDCFYTSMLNSLTDKPERQTIIIRDMLNHGIKLLPPDINVSDIDFVMANKDEVKFGLAAIKQFGDKALQAVLDDRNQRGPYGCVEEFRIRISPKLLNKTVMVNLAKCGAFDSLLDNNASDIIFTNRASLVETMPDICDAIGKLGHKKSGASEPPTVDEVLEKWEDGAGSYGVTVSHDDPIQYSIWEKEILKYYISAHPIDRYIDEIRRWNAIQNIDDDSLPAEFYIAGFVEGYHECVVKKEGRNKGKKMGFVTIGTAYRIYEATMFPGIYESCLPYLATGNPVILKGKRDMYKGAVSIQCEYIRNMTNEGIRDCPECHIRLNNPDDVIGMMQLKALFDQHYGMTKAFIHIRSGYNDITIECVNTIALNDHIIDYTESIGVLTYKEGEI
jgi:DNA polymerase-3 subunit alpha